MPLPVQWIAVGLGIGYLFSNGTLTLRGVFGFGAVAAAGLGVLLYRFQEHLLFQPRIFPQHIRPSDNPAGMRHPGEHGLGWEDVRLQAEDGTKLHAWLIRPESLEERRRRPTMLYFHENAGNMGMRMENLKMFYDLLGVNILILSYRGYGESEGLPNEEGLYQDAEACFQFIQTRADLDLSRVILFGRSLGGGVAIDLASKHEESGGISCIIVENTFSSISDMVDSIFPALAWAKGLLLRMKWHSVLKIPKITRPILFLSGAQDEIVPAVQMQALYAAATASSDKEMFVVPTGTHNDTWRAGGAEYIARIRNFIAKHALAGSTKYRLPESQPRAAL